MKKIKNELKLKQSKIHEDYITLMMTLKPSLTPNELLELFNKQYYSDMKIEELELILTKISERLLVKSEESSFDKACNIGLINYSSRTSRLILLEQIIDKSVYGENHQINTAKGDVLEIVKKDYKMALEAMKLYREELNLAEKTEQVYTVIFGKATPPKTEYLPGDEDL